MTNRFYYHTAGGLCCTLLVLGFISRAGAQGKPYAGWPNYGNEGGGTRYSPATLLQEDRVMLDYLTWLKSAGAPAIVENAPDSQEEPCETCS